MSSLDLVDNIIRITPITLIEVLCYLSIINQNLKYLYYAVTAEIVSNSINYMIKDAYIEYKFAQRPFNPGYVNSEGVSTGCGVFPGNNRSETSGLPSYHAQITTFITTILISDKELALSYISIVGLIIILSIIIIERIIVRCHTILQVVIGVIIGFITACLVKYISSKFSMDNTDIIDVRYIKQFSREKRTNKLTVSLLS